MSVKRGWAHTMGQNRDYRLLWPSVICQAIVVASYFLFILANCHPGLLVCKLSMWIVFSSNFADCLSYHRFNKMSFWSTYCYCKFWQIFCKKKSFPIINFTNFINCLSGQSFCIFLFHVMKHQNNQRWSGWCCLQSDRLSLLDFRTIP